MSEQGLRQLCHLTSPLPAGLTNPDERNEKLASPRASLDVITIQAFIEMKMQIARTTYEVLMGPSRRVFELERSGCTSPRVSRTWNMSCSRSVKEATEQVHNASLCCEMCWGKKYGSLGIYRLITWLGLINYQFLPQRIVSEFFKISFIENGLCKNKSHDWWWVSSLRVDACYKILGLIRRQRCDHSRLFSIMPLQETSLEKEMCWGTQWPHRG